MTPDAKPRCSTKASRVRSSAPATSSCAPPSGTVRVGDDERSFTGTGLRIHRQGVRDVGGFWGHCWPSALFPSRARASGALAFPERPDGQPTYNEAYVFDGERMIPATLVDAPVAPAPPARRRGRRRSPCAPPTAISASRARPSCRRAWPVARTEFAPALQQAGVRYRWDGEVDLRDDGALDPGRPARGLSAARHHAARHPVSGLTQVSTNSWVASIFRASSVPAFAPATPLSSSRASVNHGTHISPVIPRASARATTSGVGGS